MAQKWPKNGHFLDLFRVLVCDGFLEKADIYVNQCAESLECSVMAQTYSDKSSQRKALNGAKNRQKRLRNRHFLDPFRVFPCPLVNKGRYSRQ